MVGNYPVCCNGQVVGHLQVEKMGLYYCFSCETGLSYNSVYSIIAISGERKVNLGRCYRIGSTLGLKTKIAAKHFPDGNWSFSACQTQQPWGWKVSENEPFYHLDQLENARLSAVDGAMVIVPK